MNSPARRAAKRATAKTRAAARRLAVDAIRARTVCARCGAQPVDWHNPEHVEHPGRRIARMVSKRALPAILAEIAICEPLCRRCHMAEDGRAAALVVARPDTRRPARPCEECGRLYKPLRSGLCANCYMRRRRVTITTGEPR